MSYPPNYAGYPPYDNQQQQQQQPYSSAFPQPGFTPYPSGGSGMPSLAGDGGGGYNNSSGSMPGFNMPQPTSYLPGGAQHQNMNPVYPPNNNNGNSRPYGNNMSSNMMPGQYPPSAAGGMQHQPQQQQQPNQPFVSSNMMPGQYPPSAAGGMQHQLQQQQQPNQAFVSGQQQAVSGGHHQSHAQQQYNPQQQQQQQQSHQNSRPSTTSYQTVGGEPTVRPTPNFSAQNDAEMVQKAVKGFGTNEKALIKILCRRTGQERSAIAQVYKQMYGQDLRNVLQSECGGKFGDLLVALATPLDIYDAGSIRRAIEGLGTNEDTLVEILCTRSNSEINAMKNAYAQHFRRNIEQDIKGDTSGDFERLMVSLLNGCRDESTNVDQNRATQTAQELYKRGEKMIGTDEAYFNSVLAAQSQAQLRAVFEQYRRISGKDLERAVQSEMSGDLRTGMVSLVKCIRNPAVYFAEQLYRSMKGMGTDDQALIRVLVTRCDKDLGTIKREFQQLYRVPLEQMVKGDASGDYEHGLLALCGVVPA